MTDDPDPDVTMTANTIADALSASIDRVLIERDLAQTKLQIAVIALRQIARLESDVVSSIRDLARATLLDLGEDWR